MVIHVPCPVPAMMDSSDQDSPLARTEESYITQDHLAGVTLAGKVCEYLGFENDSGVPFIFYFISFIDFCGSPELETFISKEMGINKVAIWCLVQVISQCCGLVSLSPFYRCANTGSERFNNSSSRH